MNETERIECTEAPVTAEQAELVATLRAQLPLQARAKELQEAELAYHTVQWGVARRRIARSLPWRLFRWRRPVLWKIEEYPHFIPDAALLKLAEAERSGLFTSLWVAEPTYERQVIQRTDPWIIGLRARDSIPFYRYTPVSIIAYWE